MGVVIMCLFIIVECRPQIVTLLTVLGAPQSEVHCNYMNDIIFLLLIIDI